MLAASISQRRWVIAGKRRVTEVRLRRVAISGARVPRVNKKGGADGGTRTRTPKRTTDFKSVASTIPPHPHDIAQTALRPHGQGALQPKLIC